VDSVSSGGLIFTPPDRYLVAKFARISNAYRHMNQSYTKCQLQHGKPEKKGLV